MFLIFHLKIWFYFIHIFQKFLNHKTGLNKYLIILITIKFGSGYIIFLFLIPQIKWREANKIFNQILLSCTVQTHTHIHIHTYTHTHTHTLAHIYWLNKQSVCQWFGRPRFNPRLGHTRVIPKTQKMAPDAALLNTKHYKVRIKGKVEQSREWSSALPNT